MAAVEVRELHEPAADLSTHEDGEPIGLALLTRSGHAVHLEADVVQARAVCREKLGVDRLPAHRLDELELQVVGVAQRDEGDEVGWCAAQGAGVGVKAMSGIRVQLRTPKWLDQNSSVPSMSSVTQATSITGLVLTVT